MTETALRMTGIGGREEAMFIKTVRRKPVRFIKETEGRLMTPLQRKVRPRFQILKRLALWKAL